MPHFPGFWALPHPLQAFPPPFLSGQQPTQHLEPGCRVSLPNIGFEASELATRQGLHFQTLGLP